ncbi:MAG: peptidoglycan recognition protein family protein [Planctomycetota bacterium]
MFVNRLTRLIPAPRALFLCLLSLATASCATTYEPDTIPAQPLKTTDPDRFTTARTLATELGLAVSVHEGTGTLALVGEVGRIVFVDSTRTITVAGSALSARMMLSLRGGDVVLLPEDSVRIANAWHRAEAERARKEAALRTPVKPVVKRSPPRSTSTVSDPAWRVPLKRKWEGILIHHSATPSGSMAGFDRYHREVNGWLMIGYDFVICNGKGGADGLVETTQRWKQQIHGAHAGPGLKRYNDHWVGICLVGDFSKSRPTPQQMASLRRLVRYLQERCGIPDGNVRTHRDVRDTACPGDNFPLSEVTRAPRAK